MQLLQARIAENVHTTLAIGQEELIAVIIPRDFIDLKMELLLGTDFVGACIDECDKIFFVAHRNGIAIRRPRNIDILAFGIDHSRLFVRTNIPNAYRFVTAGRAQQVRLRCMPT